MSASIARKTPESHARLRAVAVLALALQFGATFAHAATSRPEIDLSAGQPTSAAAIARLDRMREDPALLRIGAVTHVDERYGVPNMVVGQDRVIARKGASVAAASAAAAARNHLTELAPYYHLDAADVAGAALRYVHDTGEGGIIAVFDQSIDGVPVFREEMKVLMDRSLALISVTGHVPGRAEAGSAEARAFSSAPNEAVALAIEDMTGAPVDLASIHSTGDAEGGYETFVGSSGAAAARIRARRVLFHLPDHLVPAYYVELLTEDDGVAYVVAADDGRVLFRHSQIANDAFTYRVWADNTTLHAPLDSPYGNTPSPHPTGSPNLYTPPFVATSLVSLQNGPLSTNDPWLAPGATTTSGNNVDAYADLVAPDGYSAGDLRVTTTSANTFNRAYDPTQAPAASSAQQMASITQLFYLNNFMHDWFYDAGFKEAAGNAQISNFGRGGVAGDPIHAEAQDYLKTSNADMYTPSDGASPRAQFYPWYPPGSTGFTLVTVNAPASIAGNKAAVAASTNPMTVDLTAPVVLPNPGSFSVSLTIPQPVTPGPEWVHIADLDGDGKADLASACFGDNSIRVQKNNGSGFNAPDIYPSAAGPYTVITADLNHDGKPDLVTANFTASSVSVRLGSGGGAFGARTDFAAGSNPACVAVGRFNADAFDDIVVANWGANSVSVLLGDGAGGFAPKVDYAMGAGPNWVAVGDLNNDGKADIVTANSGSNTVSVRLGFGTAGAFDTQLVSTCGNSPLTLALGDLNNDGKLDVVTANNADNTVASLLGQGNGFFNAPVARVVPGTPITVTLGQMNGDGLLDAVVCSDAANSFSVLAGNGAGGLGVPASFATGAAPYGVQVADVSGDGYPDVVTANFNDNSLTVHYGNPSASLPSCPPFTNTLTGCIALIDGANACDAYTKIHAAELAGAIGVILTNGTGGPLTVSPAVGIPAFQMTNVDGNPIWGALRKGTANVTLTQHTYVIRDAAIDNQIAAHEWAHYMSNRLIGNAAGLSNLQGRGMGEGWSDFAAMLLTVKPEDAAAAANVNWAGVFPSATYVISNSAAASNAFYYGIRRYPYSTDLAKDPLTFRHIQDNASLPAVARNDNFAPNSEVHNTGEIWCSALWECYASLLRATGRLTFDQARDRMRHYLVASLALTPVTPTFIEARDAMLLAANATDPADCAEFRAAFARRGMGSGAVAPERNADGNIGVTESFGVGGDLLFVSAVQGDDVHSCDVDGYLDSGEDGMLTVTLSNPFSSTVFLNATTATVSSSNPNITFPAGANLSFPTSQPGGTTHASVRVHAAGSGMQQLGYTIQYSDPALVVPGPRTASVQMWGNADEVASQSDNVEERVPAWTFAGPKLTASSVPWSRATLTEFDHAFFIPGPDSVSDRSLVSPAIAVGSGAFGFTFKQRYAFQLNYDGGVVEISTDGGTTWADIGASITPGYTGTIDPGYLNPLGGRPGFVDHSSGYPGYVSTTASLGTTYANKTVKIRFRFGCDWGGGNTPGWWIDDLAFSGITNQPFVTLVADPSTCPTVDVEEQLPTELALAIAGANPMVGAPTVRFELPQQAHVKIGVYDLVGRHVATLVDEDESAGVHFARWSSVDAATGVYFVRMVAGNRTLGQRMVLLR